MVKPYLFDTNLLIALSWPHHVHHEIARAWLVRRRNHPFRTCPITQLGFLRLTMTPAVSKFNAGWFGALELLQDITSKETHDFWPDSIDAMLPSGQGAILGPNQVTDAYLLNLATARGGILATLDRRIAVLGRELKASVEIVQAS